MSSGSPPPARDYYLGGLDDMSAWTSMVWSQAATALLGGTQDCDIPHNTLGLNCEGREGMEWVVEMMERNLEHHPTNLSHLSFLPTVEDLEVVQVD